MLSPVRETAAGQFTVCAVTVTYGDRWHLLSRVLSYLCGQQAVTKVIVVNNGATYDLRERVASAHGDRVSVIGSGQNEGSARGFGIGMKAARAITEAEFVWLLDDDNLPDTECLDAMARCWRELATGRASDRLALQALRTDRAYLLRIAAGDDPKKIFAPHNSFLDFHVTDAPRRILRKLFGRRVSVSDANVKFAKIPYGVYGGLLFHKTLLDRVGYPDEAFYLYGDDTDFTARISDGGEVYLVVGGRVEDIDRSWHVSKPTRKITVLRNLAEAPDFRVYYSVRNGVYLMRRLMRGSRLIWTVNRILYMAILRLYMRGAGVPERYRLVSRAVADGCGGRLGKNHEFGI